MTAEKGVLRSPEALASLVAVNVTPLAGILLLGWQPVGVLISYFVDTFVGFCSVMMLTMIHVTGDEEDTPIEGWRRWSKLVGALVFLVFFVLQERRASEPMIPLRLFRNKVVLACCMLGFFASVTTFGANNVLPLYFQDALFVKPTMSGLRMLPVMIGDLLEKREIAVSVLHSADRWFGMTYREDRETVAEELRRLHAAGVYPADLTR